MALLSRRGTCEVFMGLRNKTGDPAGADARICWTAPSLLRESQRIERIEHEFLISGATICCGID
jgi:hypothetical protein